MNRSILIATALFFQGLASTSDAGPPQVQITPAISLPFEALFGAGAHPTLEGVALYFGTEAYDADLKVIGDVAASTATHPLPAGMPPRVAFQKACPEAMLAGLRRLVADAKGKGATAVVQIRTGWSDVQLNSTSEYVCGPGEMRLTGKAAA